MEEEIGAILIDLVQRTTNVPGHPVTIIVEQDIEILPHVAHLRKGFVPERLQRGLGLRSILAIPKQVRSGLRFDGFDIDARDKIGKEQHVLIHIHLDFMNQKRHFHYQMGIGRIGDVGCLHCRINIHDGRAGEAQLSRPDGDRIRDLSLRLG